MQDRLETSLVAIFANCMRRFAIFHSFFQDVSEKTESQVLKFVALLVCIPCFQASHLSFKVAYLLKQRRLRRLSAENAFLKLYNRSIASSAIV